jgi:V/A-type H+-transporting ATPase subunit E
VAYPELIDALRKECEEKIRKIWEEAEGEAGKTREEASERLGKMRAEYDRDLSGAVRSRTETVLSEARSAARAVRLTAEKELSARLYRVAQESLPLLRNDRYRDIFESLAGELPQGEWDVVRVRPGDREIARSCFPVSRIQEEEGISGGFEVTSESGRVRIVNTFEKRLERAWAEMLPGIMKDIYETPGGK